VLAKLPSGRLLKHSPICGVLHFSTLINTTAALRPPSDLRHNRRSIGFLCSVGLVLAAGERVKGLLCGDSATTVALTGLVPTHQSTSNPPNHPRSLCSCTNMDEFTVDAFVNRDDPIPVISFDINDDLSDEAESEPATTEKERKRDKLLQHGKNLKDNFRNVQGKASETGSSMQDRLLEKYVCDPSTLNLC
jgi:hypothetical protein